MLSEDIIAIVEKKMNEWANGIAPRYKIKPGTFKINIKENVDTLVPTKYGYVVSDGSYHDWSIDTERSTVVRPKRVELVKPENFEPRSSLLATVRNGTIVQINLYTPLIKKEEGETLQSQLQKTIKRMKATCKELLRYIANPKRHRDDELFNPTIVGSRLHEYILGAGATKVWKRKRINTQILNEHHKSEFSILIQKQVTFVHKETGISYTVVDHNNSKSEWEMEYEAWDRCSARVNEKEYRDTLGVGVALVKYGHYNTLQS